MSNNNDDFVTRDQGQPEGRQQRSESQAEQPRREQRQAPNEQSSSNRDFTLADLGRMSARPSTGGLSDAALAAMIDQFENSKAFDKPNVPEAISRKRFRVIPLTQDVGRTSLSSLLVTLPTEIQSKRFTLVYVLLIEQPGGPGLRTLTDRGESFEALILPEDVMTERYVGVIKDQVANLQEAATVIVVGHQVLLHNTVATISEKEGQQAIAAIYDNAMDAICGVRENIVDSMTGRRNDGMRINPGMVKRTDRLEVAFDYSGKPSQDTSGLQVRSDVLANLYYSAATPEEDNMYSRTQLGEVRAGLDLFLAADGFERDRPSFGRGRRSSSRDEDSKPFWQPVYNITDVNCPAGLPFSLELAQLLIAQVAIQSNDYRWANVLRPRQTIAAPGVGTMKALSQLSHLHLLHPDKEKAGVITDISQNLPDADLYDFLDVTVKPEIAFGMMIPSSGEKSWAMSIFERIATLQGRDADKYITTLFESADTLTGGNFSPIYDELTKNTRPKPVASTGTRVFIGTWTDSDGIVRDLREWNVPAVLTTVGAKNPTLAEDYQFTFEDDRHSVEYSLAARYAILSRIVPGLRVVGTCEQLSFNPDYIQALSEALEAAGMASLPTSSDGLQSARRVGNTSFSNFATSEIGSTRRRPTDRDGRQTGRDRFTGGGSFY